MYTYQYFYLIYVFEPVRKRLFLLVYSAVFPSHTYKFLMSKSKPNKHEQFIKDNYYYNIDCHRLTSKSSGCTVRDVVRGNMMVNNW